ncbi:MAG: hypothetical protein V7786_06905 [Sulfitobacter litoralis]|uniref:hypothetical protein n=1 Tax=Sulfitobacter litoralis TaxID=335975 RepID=UPI003001A7C4
MQSFDIILSVTSVLVSAVGLWIVYWIVKTSGRDRPRNPERVQDLVDRVNRREADGMALTDKTTNLKDAR